MWSPSSPHSLHHHAAALCVCCLERQPEPCPCDTRHLASISKFKVVVHAKLLPGALAAQLPRHQAVLADLFACKGQAALLVIHIPVKSQPGQSQVSSHWSLSLPANDRPRAPRMRVTDTITSWPVFALTISSSACNPSSASHTQEHHTLRRIKHSRAPAILRRRWSSPRGPPARSLRASHSRASHTHECMTPSQTEEHRTLESITHARASHTCEMASTGRPSSLTTRSPDEISPQAWGPRA